ncbi:MAG: transposase [Candidatus Saccharibacteria bacterium]
MPSRNIIRSDAPNSYYHVYSRGINKSNVFVSVEDKDYFLYLLSRHLSIKPVMSTSGYTYPHLRGRVELLVYCLMDNHFHLMFYQVGQGQLSDLMQSILSAYTAYFNRKYGRRGPLFESRFKSSLVNKETYLMHVSRYIHLNPRSWKYYPYSSIIYIRKGNEPEWLQTKKILNQHANRADYLDFVADYEENKEMLSELKYQLANL